MPTSALPASRAACALLATLGGALACSRTDAPPPQKSAMAAAPVARPDSTRRDSQPASVLLALDGGGVMLVIASTGSTRALEFGQPAAAAITALTAVLGAPLTRGMNEDCGAGPLEVVTFAGGLDAHLQRDKFVGWTSRPVTDAPPQTTMSGIGLGSTRAQLDSVYTAVVTRSTLGVEFTAAGLQGILSSMQPTAVITDIWAGVSCVAR